MAGTRKPENTATAAEAHSNKPTFSLISDDTLLQLYSTMLKCRLLNERLRRLFSKDKSLWNDPMASGHEAAFAGIAADLTLDDTIAAQHPSSIASFVKGVPLTQIFTHLKSGTDSSFDVAAMQAGIFTHISHSALLHIAGGVAFSIKRANTGKIAVVFSSDAAPLESWQRAFAFTATHSLPVLYVCPGNLSKAPSYGKTSPRTDAISAAAQTSRIPGIHVDGHDVVAVYRVAHEAIARARKGRGPTLIVCIAAHRGNRARPGDAIANMEAYLAGKNLFRPELTQKILASYGTELDAAIASMRKPAAAPGKKRSHTPARPISTATR
jgi:TPP-dependent pyruvate/acetoin dehydrogenase alpha subunit